MLPNTSKTPEFKKLHNLPKGVEFAILSKRFNEVRSAAQRIEMLMPTPVAPKPQPNVYQPTSQEVAAKHVQQAFQASAPMGPKPQEFVNTVATPNQYPVDYASVPEGTPNMLDESDDAMAAAARQSISAIHDEMQREIVGNPLFQAAQQPEVRNQGEFTRAA
jgi:hypothetical protein